MDEVVCLDAGHGGYDSGAVGNGLMEKDLTLALVMMMKPMLEFNSIGIVLTRDGDYAPRNLEWNLSGELSARVDIANKANVDLMVSVHINSGGGTGTEVLIIGGGGQSEVCANKVLPLLVESGQWYNRGVKVQNVKVLKTNAPAILTESGFIDSVSDTNKLKNYDFLKSLAVAHVKGICQYFGKQYKEKQSEVIGVEVAILCYTLTDLFGGGVFLSLTHGNCAIYVRTSATSYNPDVMKAKKLYTIGGSAIGHPNETVLSGYDGKETFKTVANSL